MFSWIFLENDTIYMIGYAENNERVDVLDIYCGIYYKYVITCDILQLLYKV